MFDKKIECDCVYCSLGYTLNNEKDIICEKFGLVSRNFNCKNFIYNPLNRKPKGKILKKTFEKNEFKITSEEK